MNKLTFLLILLTSVVSAQEILIPDEKDGKWGYISFETKRVVIPHQYSLAEAFTDHGIAKIKIGDKWGLLGSDGKELVPVIYDWIYTEEYSKIKITRFKLNGKWGLFGPDFNTILPAKYEMIHHFQSYYLDESKNNINDQYQRNIRKILVYFKAKKAGKWGVIDETDQTILSFKYDDIAYILKKNFFYTTIRQPELRLSDPLTAFCGTRMPLPVSKNFFAVKKGNKGKIISQDEKVIYTLNDYHTKWEHKLSMVIFYVNRTGKLKHNIFVINKNNKLGIISTKGKLLLPFEYEAINHDYNNILHVKKAGKYGIVNSFGDILQPPVYDKISGHQVTLKNKHGILSADYKSLLFPLVFDDIKKYKKNNGGFYSPHKLIHIQKYDKEGLLNEKGEEMLPLNNQTIVFNKNSLSIKKDSLWGMMDYDLSMLLKMEYDSIINTRSAKQMFVVKKKNKVGLWNKSTKDWEIPLEYDSIKIRSKKEAVAQKNKKWGLFHFGTGKVAEIKYDKIKKYKGRIGDQWEILAPYKKQQKQIEQAEKREQQGIQKRAGKYGVVGKDDQWLLPPKYEKIWNNGRFYTIVQGDKKGIMASDGRFIIPPEYEEVSYNIGDKFLRTKKHDKWGIINTENEIIIPFNYDRIEKLKDGVLKVLDGDYWTMIDMKGNPICESSFSSISKMRYYFKSGPIFFFVTKHYLAGIIDELGNEILPCRFQSVQPEIFSIQTDSIPQLFPVKNRGKWGYAQKGGKVVIPFQFEKNSYFNKNMAIVNNDEKYFLINKKGEIINDEGYEKVVSINRDTDLAIVVNKQGKHGAINSTGKEIIPFIYDDLEEAADRVSRRLYHFRLNGKYGVIDHKGVVLVRAYSRFRVDRLELGMITSKNYSLRGLNGKILLKESYDNAKRYYKNFYIVEKNGKLGIVDILTEKEILPLEYTDILPNKYNKCAVDYFVVKKGEKVGLVDHFNKLILPFNYESIHYHPHLNILILRKNGKAALADMKGKLITGFEYEEISPAQYPPFPVKKNEKWGYIDTTGKIIYPIELEKANRFYTYYDNRAFTIKNTPCNPPAVPDSIQLQASIEIAGKYFWLSTDGKITENSSIIRNKAKETKPTKTEVAPNIFKTYDPVSRDRFLVDENGEKMIPDNLSAVHKYSGGFIPFRTKKGNYGFYFPSVKKRVYYEAVQTYPHNDTPIRWVRNNEKFGFINNKGEEVTPKDFEMIGENKEGMISVLKDGKMGFLDESGAMKIPMKFEDDGNYRPYFEKGVAYAYLNGKYGFINPEGETVAPFEYEAIAYFNEGVAIAYRNEKWEKIEF